MENGSHQMKSSQSIPDSGFPDVRNLVVELAGLTRAARMVLNNRPLVILYFPFRMGRLSRSDPASTAKQDLLLPDFKPFFVSRNHILFDREGDSIVLIDEASTCGTVVDDKLIGRRGNVPGHAKLSRGTHLIAIGGHDSPYLFKAEVRPQKASDFLVLDGSVPDRLPQARMLYRKLCDFEQRLIGTEGLSAQELNRTAREMARVLIERADLLDPIRCMASNPVCGEQVTAQHSVNVAVFTIALYGGMKASKEEIVTNTAAALLHDIGMMSVAPGIISKQGPLTPEEFAEVKKHTIAGRERLDCADHFGELAAAAADGHHERIDSSGYPQGTNLIAETTRFLGLLDVFEALTHDRPHRPAFTPHEAVRQLTAKGNPAFDAETRKAFLNAFSFFPVSTIVKLSTGEIGQVVGINCGRPLRPVVRVLQNIGGSEGNEGRLVNLQDSTLISIVKEVPDRDLLKRYAI